MKMDRNNPPMPDYKKLVAAIDAADFAAANAGTLSKEEIEELVEAAKWAVHAVPDGANFLDFTSRNPVNQVFFRAGLIAARETMARFVEQGGNPEIAASIRANWWPQLGDDPGAPRLLNFDELCTEQPDGKFVSVENIGPSLEALPRAHQFLAARTE